MKLVVVLKSVVHLVISPWIVRRSQVATVPILYSTAMRRAIIVLQHIALQENGVAYKSPVAPNIAKLRSRWAKELYARCATAIYRHADRQKLVFVNWGYSAVDRLGFLPEDLGFDNRYVENDLFGFGRDQNRPVVGYLIDRQRPYFDGRGPTDMEQMLNDYESGAWKSDPAALTFLDTLRAAKMHKYSQFSARSESLSVNHDDLLIFGQVERDAAWVKNLSSVKTNVELIAKAIDSVPGVRNIYFKAHPKHKPWPQDQVEIARLFPQITQIDPAVSFKSLLVNQPSVFVNTSGTGLDAGLAGCKVYSAGLAFYSGWGATVDVGPVTDRRKNRLTFEDIVIVICTQYSRYFFRENFASASIVDLISEMQRALVK